MMKMSYILVADSQPIFVEGLRALLSSSTSMLFSGRIETVTRSSSRIVESIRHQEPDLLLLDLSLPDTEGLNILAVAKKCSPQTRVLAMTDHDDPRLAKAAFRAGADGYLLKNASKEELYRAIEEVLNGQPYLSLGAATSDYYPVHTNGNGAAPEERFARQYGLTRREIEVFQLIGQALNNKDIADRLYISDQTAGVHRKNIMRKLGVNNTSNLIKLAYDHHLV